GTFKSLKDYAKKETQDKSDQSEREKTHELRSGSVDVDTTIGPILSKNKTKVTWHNENDRDWAKTDKVEAYRLDEILKTIDADIPVAALDAKQLQNVASRTESEFKVGLGTFQDGQKTLVQDLSMQSLFASPAAKKAKTQEEVDKEALEAAEEAVKKAREQLDKACEKREAIRVDNKVHEDRLAALKAQLPGVTANWQAADSNYSDASARTQEAYDRMLFKNNDLWNHWANHFKLTELGATSGAWGAFKTFLDNEVQARETDLQPARAKLVEAEKNCEKLKVDLDKAEADLRVLKLKQQIKHRP